jgi:hypothetical protein
MGSLTELLEDFFDLEKDYKEGQRMTRKNKEAALIEISKIIKLIMGEKAMPERQIDRFQKRYIDKGDEKAELKIQRNNRLKRQIVNNFYQKHW